MLPFSLKVVWFVLCFIGTAASWIVLYAFWKAVARCWWILVFYGGAVTVLVGAMLLGMIWKMDPFLMPREFCIAQIFLISFSALVITGFCSCFSFATTTTFLLPSQADTSAHSVLRWRNAYLIPVLVVPALAATTEAIVFVKLDAIQVTDNLHCEIGDPLWIRWLGYSGVSFLLSLPAFILAILAGVRMNKNHKAHRRLSRELYDSNFNYSPSLELFTDRGDSPVSRIIMLDEYPGEARLSPSGRVIPDEPPSPGLSSTSTASLFIADPVSYPAHPEDVGNPAEDAGRYKNKTPSSVVPNGSYSTMSEPEPHYAKTSGTIVRTHSKKSSQSAQTKKFRRGLFSDIWRLLLFQIGFFIIEVLVMLSTLISTINRRPPPAFGTEHVALLLTAWGPSMVFIHSPSVWRQIRSWL